MHTITVRHVVMFVNDIISVLLVLTFGRAMTVFGLHGPSLFIGRIPACPQICPSAGDFGAKPAALFYANHRGTFKSFP